MVRNRTKTDVVRRIVLLDTHAILHRAYHALPGFTSPLGEPTGALYGLGAFFLKVIGELHPDQVIAAYDLPGPTHRHEAFHDYKGTRVKADDELVAQLVRSRDLLDALAVPRLEAPGFEADDILGTLSALLTREANNEIIIASGDMDTLQLVQGQQVRVYTLKQGLNDTVVYDEAGVITRYGFGPGLIPDYKGLRGDPSDNIPGVKGIGEKTATHLITTFGSLDDIYEALHTRLERVTAAGITPRIVRLLEEGEDEARFSKELATIRRDAPVAPPSYAPWRETVDRAHTLRLFSELGFRTLADRFRTLMGTVGDEEIRNVPPETDLTPEEYAETGLALWLVASDITNPSREDMFDHTHTNDVRVARARIMGELHDLGLTKLYETIERPLMPVVARMEGRGILLDRAYLALLSKRYHADLEAISARIYAAAGHPFNINSPRQLGQVLFVERGIGKGTGKRTATGQRSTREDELRKYLDEPIVADILEYRELQKLLSTYIDNLPSMCDVEGRLHAHFSQTGTTTGRLSSQSPNMQNIPTKTTRGAAIRKAIVAPEGYTLLAVDYSQIELRVAAFLSRDETLMRCFVEGQDIHTAVAAQIFDVPPERVSKDMRRRAKVINFGILYGMGAGALAEATGTTRAEAKTYLDEYFKRFAGISRYMEKTRAVVHGRGYTETWFGRRRYFEGIRSPLPQVRAQAERMALNAPIQGTQADIIKIAMCRVDDVLRVEGFGEDAFLILQVHDELVYEVRDRALQRCADLVRETMEHVLSREETGGVPLTVDVEVGKNWGEMELLPRKP